ncbi:hypothetical protein BH10BAC1_BH10BAC1_19130 [soil metagenome]
MKNKFLILATLTIILLFVFYGGVYYLQNKPKPTKQDPKEVGLTSEFPSLPKQDTYNFKTYNNTKYGFEFKYPTDGYKLFESEDNSYVTFLGLLNPHITITTVTSSDDPEYLPHFNIGIVENTSVSDLDIYIRKLFDASSSPVRYVSSQKVNINGTLWSNISVKEGINNFSEERKSYYVFYSNGKLYWMYFYGAPSSDLEKIPSTFKFIK